MARVLASCVSMSLGCGEKLSVFDVSGLLKSSTSRDDLHEFEEKIKLFTQALNISSLILPHFHTKDNFKPLVYWMIKKKNLMEN